MCRCPLRLASAQTTRDPDFGIATFNQMFYISSGDRGIQALEDFTVRVGTRW